MAVLQDTLMLGPIGSGRLTGRKIEKDGKQYDEVARLFTGLFGGEGWRLSEQDGKYTLVVDGLVVRDTMSVFELLIEKIRAVKGALTVSAASGKVAAVDHVDGLYYLTMEEGAEHGFVKRDLVMCQRFKADESAMERYYVGLRDVTSDGRLMIAEGAFQDGAHCTVDHPSVGDELVQMGHVSNPARQGAIYIHAHESEGRAAIDIKQGISSRDAFAGSTVVRLGGSLPGSPDAACGLWAKNGKIVGTRGDIEVYCFSPDGTGHIGAEGDATRMWWDAEGLHIKAEEFDVSSDIAGLNEAVTTLNGIANGASVTALAAKDTATAASDAVGVLGGSMEALEGRVSDIETGSGFVKTQNGAGLYASVTNPETGETTVGLVGVVSTEDGRTVIGFQGDQVEFCGTDGKPYIKVGQYENGCPYFIFVDPTTGKEAYNLGYRGLKEIIDSSVQAHWEAAVSFVRVTTESGGWPAQFPLNPPASQFASYRMFVAAKTEDASGNPIFAPAEGADFDQCFFTSTDTDAAGLPMQDNMMADGVYAIRRGDATDSYLLEFYRVRDGRTTATDVYHVSLQDGHYTAWVKGPFGGTEFYTDYITFGQ